jgi:hypothetical protein
MIEVEAGSTGIVTLISSVIVLPIALKVLWVIWRV